MTSRLIRRPLGEVLTQRTEFIRIDETTSYKRCRVQLHAAGIVLRDTVSGTEIKTKQQQVCKTGDFLVAEIDAKVGGFGILPDELDGAIVSSHYFLFEIDERQLDRKFLGFFIRTPEFFDQVKAQGSTNYAAIRPQDVLRYEIPLPPLEEQRRIVARIEALAAKIEEAKRLRSEALGESKALEASYAKRVFEQGFSKGWKQIHLGDVLVDCTYGTSDKANDDSFGTPVLRMGNIQDGLIDSRHLKYLIIHPKDRDKWILQKGDILVNRTNSAELVGKSAVFDSEQEFTFASYLIRIRLNTTLATPHYVAGYINSPAGREYMFHERKQMTGQANVNSQKLRALPITLPPIDQQMKIVDALANLRPKREQLLGLYGETSKELDAILPSVLDKAFKGEL